MHEHELALRHTQLRADIYNYFISGGEGVRNFYDKFAARLRELLQCDQLLYRDINGICLIENAPGMDKLWRVPARFCRQCPHFEIDAPVYADGWTEMSDTAAGYKGVPTYCECPVKASLTRIIYLDGKAFGYLAAHYLGSTHEYSDLERDTLEEICRILSLSVSGYQARKINKEYELREQERRQEAKLRADNLINFFTQDSESTFLVNFADDSARVIKEDERCKAVTGSSAVKPYREMIGKFIDNLVFDADRFIMREILSAEFLSEKLAAEQRFTFNFRQTGESGRPSWSTFTAAQISDDEVLLNFADRNERILSRMAGETLLSSYISVYYVNLNLNLITEVKTSPVFKFKGGGGISSIENNVKGLMALADEEYRPALLQFVSIDHLKQVLSEDDSTEFIYSSHITGSLRWVKCTLLVADRQNGVPVNLIMMFSNVEKEQVERLRLNREVAQLHVIADSFTDSFTSTYYIGLTDLSYEVYKRTEYYNLRYPQTDNYLDSLLDYVRSEVHPDDRAKIRAAIQPENIRARLVTAQSYSETYRDISMENERVFRLMVIRGADSDHAALGFMEITQEINAEQARMRAVEEANKANEASRMKSRFVQNLSHDIRTPLNAIVGYSQLLAMPGDILSEDEKSEFAEYINDSADMLTMLIDDVLSVSDIEHDILSINIGDTFPNSVCMKAINCSKMRVQVGVDMHYTSEVDNSFKFRTDPKRVQQIIVNFLSNACKHTTEGEIHVHCSTSENPGQVTFSVTDTGCGVSPDKAELIFKRFNTNGKSNSHGLGLDICRDLARRLGGNIGLDKSYTDGARFYLTLPLEQ